MPDASHLPASIVYDLAGILDLSDQAFIVGGQALNLWAERYHHVPELAAYGPYTSKDIDYFGYREAAEKLANALGGELRIPDPDDQTPQTAIVHATVAGARIEIDFLDHVLGVDDEQLKRQAIQIIMKVRLEEGIGELHVPIMHPLHCLQSRLANVVTLGRHTELVRNQLEASAITLREFLSEQLNDNKTKHVTSVLQALYRYLTTDIVGRKAHKIMKNDPAEILGSFQDDERLDPRWREMSLHSMRQSIERKRSAWRSMAAAVMGFLSKSPSSDVE